MSLATSAVVCTASVIVNGMAVLSGSDAGWRAMSQWCPEGASPCLFRRSPGSFIMKAEEESAEAAKNIAKIFKTCLS